MIWNAPLALAALALVVGPLLVHLLVRQHAARVLYPAMRFVPGVRAAAVRMRRPSDVALLVLRLAIVAAAALAVAQPVFVTAERQRGWAARVTRAVVVDTSASVPAAAAGEIAVREMAGAFVAEQFPSPDVRDGLRRAIEWLSTTPASQREVSIVSDFQAGAVERGDLTDVPPEIGIRLARAGPPSPPRVTPIAVDGWRQGRWLPSIAFTALGTEATWRRETDAAIPPVDVLAPEADLPAARRALAAALAEGMRVAPARRIEIAFAGTATSDPGAPSTAWIASAAIALQRSDLAAATRASLVAGERDGVLAVRTSLSASSPLAPAAVRAVVAAASDPVADRELEPRALDDGVLSAWRRAPSATAAGVPPDQSDGRWLWALALALLAVETVVRRRRSESAAEVHADAA
jgi:hypothetical protein